MKAKWTVKYDTEERMEVQAFERMMCVDRICSVLWDALYGDEYVRLDPDACEKLAKLLDEHDINLNNIYS